MNPQAYCNKKACILGSGFSYSLRKLSKEKCDAIVAVQAFYQEIEEVTFHFSDLGVAQSRLNWWREEILKIHSGNPSHPVSQCLLQHRVSSEKLMEILEGLQQNLSYLSFATFDEVVVHFMRTAGVRELLFAEILNPDVSPNRDSIYQAMLAMELTNYIQHLHRYVQRDLIYFSDDELMKFQVNRADLQEYKTTSGIRALLQFQVEKIERAIAGCELYVRDKPFFSVRIAIARATIKEIIASDFTVLESFIDLTPLRRWWISV